MTDISSWTDEQVNEAIFEAKGWFIVDQPAPHWEDNGGSTWYWQPPDYTHNWQLCGELLDEMKADLCFDESIGMWECEYYTEYSECETHLFVTAPTAQRAICDAWLMWRKKKR